MRKTYLLKACNPGNDEIDPNASAPPATTFGVAHQDTAQDPANDSAIQAMLARQCTDTPGFYDRMVEITSAGRYNMPCVLIIEHLAHACGYCLDEFLFFFFAYLCSAFADGKNAWGVLFCRPFDVTTY